MTMQHDGQPMRDEAVRVQEVALEMLHQTIAHVFEDMPTTRGCTVGMFHLSPVLMGTVMKLRASVLAHKTVEKEFKVEFQTPRNWWELLKEDHAPMWFLKRFPTKFMSVWRTSVFEEYDTYPRARIDLPKEKFGQPIIHQFWKA